jgi:Flp pilus assembly protein TadB
MNTSQNGQVIGIEHVPVLSLDAELDEMIEQLQYYSDEQDKQLERLKASIESTHDRLSELGDAIELMQLKMTELLQPLDRERDRPVARITIQAPLRKFLRRAIGLAALVGLCALVTGTLNPDKAVPMVQIAFACSIFIVLVLPLQK